VTALAVTALAGTAVLGPPENVVLVNAGALVPSSQSTGVVAGLVVFGASAEAAATRRERAAGTCIAPRARNLRLEVWKLLEYCVGNRLQVVVRLET
jgi:hypothetical protein